MTIAMDTDETSQEDQPPVALDEHDRAAVIALLIRTVRIDEELKRDKELVTSASARVASNTLARSKTVTAFGVFGFDTSDGLWDRVIKAIGPDAYGRAIAIGKGYEPAGLLEKMGDEEAIDEAEQNVTRPDDDDASERQAPRLKDAILGYLQGLGDAGATARQVRQHLVDAYGLSVHEKTPGMTLYRLMKEGSVRRVGRTWYAKGSAGSRENEPPSGQAAGASGTSDERTTNVDQLIGE